MTTTTPPPAESGAARDRLLSTAARLFYERGVHIGVDAVCREAGVSKRTMYQLFTDKDALIAASLQACMPEWATALLPGADVREPRARILHVFSRLESLERDNDFLGCPFVATAVQVRDADHPANQVVRTQKDAITAFFRHEAARAGVSDPEHAARQLLLVFDGASARSVVRAEDLAGLATTTAMTVFDAALHAESHPETN